jgi:hypothetical protein
VNNDPVNWVDPWGLEGKPTVRDVLTAITNPIGAFVVLANRSKVTSYINNNPSLFPQTKDAGHNDSEDAFRHAAWNARDLGAAEAKRFGDAHEANTVQPYGERVMDLHNNEVGRSLGVSQTRLSDQEIFDRVFDAMEEGKLITTMPKGFETSTYTYGEGYKNDSCKR